ncbi:L-serine ammonia-lyase, iron-sulfur-dependent, subunit alpha [Peptoniphilus sp. GNH]|nr:hypothetical protein HMPREF3189_00585 [Clostridiales bacterium KA00134]UHR02273.1 L-serine ammonia-lyase, iron-sulfur-dependent, subunit alpha [Peptoniphilus sp. GNH]
MDYKEYLKQELITAFGCTEPIAIAYASAKASEVLGAKPEKLEGIFSGNIIKNAHSITVPGTDGRKGIEISIVAGAFLGNADKKLEVLADIDKSKLKECDQFIKEGSVSVELKPNTANLYIEIIAKKGKDESRVIIKDDHTNIVLIEKNSEVIFEKSVGTEEDKKVDFSFEKIYEFSKSCDYTDIKDIFDKEIEYNYAIAKEGITNNWGSNIGKIILENSNGDYFESLTAYASAGSDARMSGAENPVVINSGSGNQGITLSVPIIKYALDNKVDRDTLYRALIFGNLIGLYLKQGIGKLSAYCGVVSAASASICGIAYMEGKPLETIKETISNALAVNSGLICDGAKASCAMKIASSLRNAFLAYRQALSNNSFHSGDGIVKDDIEKTIDTVGHIARYGMKKTDEVVLNEMIENRNYLKEFE